MKRKRSNVLQAGVPLNVQKHLCGFLHLHKDALKSAVARELSAFTAESMTAELFPTFVMEYTPSDVRKFLITKVLPLEKSLFTDADGTWDQMNEAPSETGTFRITILLYLEGVVKGETICTTTNLDYREEEQQAARYKVPLKTFVSGINAGMMFLFSVDGKILPKPLNERIPSRAALVKMSAGTKG